MIQQRSSNTGFMTCTISRRLPEGSVKLTWTYSEIHFSSESRSMHHLKTFLCMQQFSGWWPKSTHRHCREQGLTVSDAPRLSLQSWIMAGMRAQKEKAWLHCTAPGQQGTPRPQPRYSHMIPVMWSGHKKTYLSVTLPKQISLRLPNHSTE